MGKFALGVFLVFMLGIIFLDLIKMQERVALANPGYSLSCSEDKKSVIITTGDGLKARIALGDSEACEEVKP